MKTKMSFSDFPKNQKIFLGGGKNAQPTKYTKPDVEHHRTRQYWFSTTKDLGVALRFPLQRSVWCKGMNQLC